MSLAGIHVWVHRALWAPGATTAGVLLVAITVIGVVGWHRLTRSSVKAVSYSALLLAVTLWWWLVNSPLEGRVLYVVTANHGFTLGDAIGVPAVIMAMGLLGGVALRWIRSRRPSLS